MNWYHKLVGCCRFWKKRKTRMAMLWWDYRRTFASVLNHAWQEFLVLTWSSRQKRCYRPDSYFPCPLPRTACTPLLHQVHQVHSLSRATRDGYFAEELLNLFKLFCDVNPLLQKIIGMQTEQNMHPTFEAKRPWSSQDILSWRSAKMSRYYATQAGSDSNWW